MEGLSNYEKEIRPWGDFERFTLNEETTVKIITAKPNETLSLQTHAQRQEFWKILSGSGTVTLGEETHAASAGDTFFIQTGEKHRMSAGSGGVSWLEIAFGHFDEGDIIRLEDRYGRA